jgi:pSer/pThr/pTyr-binding forkhead associated (FHA) protein
MATVFRAGTMLRITILRHGVPEHEVDLTDSVLRIGRGVANDLLLTDPEKLVSRAHGRIVRSGDDWVYHDQGSLNGSWVDGERVEHVRLAPGIVIRVGDYELLCDARDSRPTPIGDETVLDGGASAETHTTTPAPGPETGTRPDDAR